MCGRYTGNLDDSETIRNIYTTVQNNYPSVKLSCGEIFPTNIVPILQQGERHIRPIPAKWGYPERKGNYVMINAKAETAGIKPTFSKNFRYNRCVIPTTGYYEWNKNREKYLFRHANSNTVYLGGLYNACEDGIRFVILTTGANSSGAQIHDRMPVVLSDHMLYDWIHNVDFAEWYVHASMPEMVSDKMCV